MGNATFDDSTMALEIIAFVSFRSRPNNGWVSDQMNDRDQGSRGHWLEASPEKTVLFPTESDLLLSALEPFRESTDVRIKVYDLSTTLGRFQGLFNSVLEAPAVIIDGKHHIGWKAAQLALSRLQENAV